MKLVTNISNLSDWKNVILNIRGPYPTLDSEIVLSKMIEDITLSNCEMKRLKKSMIDLIYFHNLNLINIQCDVWNEIYRCQIKYLL